MNNGAPVTGDEKDTISDQPVYDDDEDPADRRTDKIVWAISFLTFAIFFSSMQTMCAMAGIERAVKNTGYSSEKADPQLVEQAEMIRRNIWALKVSVDRVASWMSVK